MNEDGSEVTRLTEIPGADMFPSFSRDGSKIVFESKRSGSDDIFLMNLDGSGIIRLTNNAADDTFPSFFR